MKQLLIVTPLKQNLDNLETFVQLWYFLETGPKHKQIYYIVGIEVNVFRLGIHAF